MTAISDIAILTVWRPYAITVVFTLQANVAQVAAVMATALQKFMAMVVR